MPSDDRTRWDAKYEAQEELAPAPSPFLAQIEHLLPPASSGARVLDVAGATPPGLPERAT